MSVGVAAHVFSGNCGVVRRSKPRNPRADCVLGHGVATALRHGFVPRFRVAPLAATALRLSEQVQGNLDAVRAVYGGTGKTALPQLFCALLPQFRGVGTPPTRSIPPRPRPKPPRTTPKRPAPGAKTPQMTPARGRRRRQPHPSAPGCPRRATPVKKQHKLRTSAPRPRANRQTQKRRTA